MFAVGTDGIVNAPSQDDVTNNRLLRADNTWQTITGMIGNSLSISDGTDTWTFTADGDARTLTLDLNGTNEVRWTRNADTNRVDLRVTGDILGNQGIIT